MATLNTNIVWVRKGQGTEVLKRRVQSNSARAAYNFARAGVVQVRNRAPKRTGYLASQVKWKRHGYGDFEVYIDGNTTTKTGAYYAPYVEYGHIVRNQHGTHGYKPANPFFRQAIIIQKRIFIQEMKAVFK